MLSLCLNATLSLLSASGYAHQYNCHWCNRNSFLLRWAAVSLENDHLQQEPGRERKKKWLKTHSVTKPASKYYFKVNSEHQHLQVDASFGVQEKSSFQSFIRLSKSPLIFSLNLLNISNAKPTAIMLFLPRCPPPLLSIKQTTWSCQRFGWLEMFLPVLRISWRHSPRHPAASRVLKEARSVRSKGQSKIKQQQNPGSQGMAGFTPLWPSVSIRECADSSNSTFQIPIQSATARINFLSAASFASGNHSGE